VTRTEEPSAASSVSAASPERLHLQRVTENTVVAIDPRLVSNAAAVVVGDFVVVVDVGMRPYASRLFRAALEEGFQRPVKFVCVTHYHADHTFGLQAFKDATVFASRQIVDTLAQSPDWSPEARARWKQDDPEGGEWLDEVEFVQPQLLFQQALDIVGGDDLVEFYHSGGHTSCSVYGYYPREKVLLAGDLIFAGRFPFAGDASTDPETWMSTLRTWLELDIEQVIPGHGPVSGKDEIAKQLEFLEILKRNTLQAIKAGGGHRDIVMPTVYPPAAEDEWFAGRTLERSYTYYRSKA
jgi:glyoxylase-like metal-dependent hydrolase (beta-lactamase superfamily II)